MKLIKCYIENFGKLHNYEFNFNDGLNTILEENGFGKTTFANFIKSMFYGLDASRAESSDRKKYKPWQGGIFGGNIEFEVEDKKYRIERTFGAKQTDDTFKLYNLKTGLESHDYSENIGEEIFKINKSGYERSTYIPQNQIQIEMEDSLSAKLGNVLESGNDIDSSEEAINKLDDAIKIYVKRGGKGELNDKKEELNEKIREFENSKFDETNLENYQKILEEKNSKLKEIEDEKKKNQDLLAKKIEEGRKDAKKEVYDKICKNLEENKKAKSELDNFFKAGIPDNNEIKELKESCFKIERLKSEAKNKEFSADDENKLETLNKEFDGKNITEGEIDEKLNACTKIQKLKENIQNEKINKEAINQKIKQKEVAKKSKDKKIIFAIIVSLIIIGTSLILKLIPVAILGAVLTIISIILKFKNKQSEEIKELKSELDEKAREIEVMESNKQMLEETVNKLVGDIENDSDKILKLANLRASLINLNELKAKKIMQENEVRKTIEEKKNLETKVENYLKKYFSKIDEIPLNLIQEIESKKIELNRLNIESEKISKEKEEFENENNIEEIEKKENLDDIDENSLNLKISNLEEEAKNITEEKSQIKNNIEVLENKIDENEYLETSIENLKEEISAMEEKVNILQKTKEFLESAKESFSSQYLNTMVQGFEKYLNLIDDKDLKTNIDINLGVSVDVNGQKKDIKNFSVGYKDLIYICMRFSLINALFEGEKPFVILDDPLVNLDNSKTQKALNLIKELSKDYQIIYFVCNNSRE